MQGTQQQGCEKGLWTNERPHAMVPHQRRRGIRHSLSLVLAPASTVPSGSKYDHDVAGTGGGPGCGYWMRGLFRHSVLLPAGRKVPKLPRISCEAFSEECPDPGHQPPIARLRYGDYIHPEELSLQ